MVHVPLTDMLFCLHGIFKELELGAVLIMGVFKLKFMFLTSLKNGKIWLQWTRVPKWDQLAMDGA